MQHEISDTLKIVLSAFGGFITLVCITVIGWIKGRHQRIDQKIDQVHTRINDVEQRERGYVTREEAKQDVNNLRQEIREGFRAMGQRIDDHLNSRGRK